jgi:hypothetical protein
MLTLLVPSTLRQRRLTAEAALLRRRRVLSEVVEDFFFQGSCSCDGGILEGGINKGGTGGDRDGQHGPRTCYQKKKPSGSPGA